MKISIRKQFDNLTDELIEDIFNTPDSEILKEVKEDYGDKLYEVKRFKKILQKAKNSLDKE